jgi:hypothetical protein
MNDTIICNTPESINAYRLLALRSALKLELVGMKASRGFSAYATIKREFGFNGNKQSVSDQFATYLREQKILIDKTVAIA